MPIVSLPLRSVVETAVNARKMGAYIRSHSIELVLALDVSSDIFVAPVARLWGRSIGSDRILLSSPTSLQTALPAYGHKVGDFPVIEVLALPIFAGLAEEEIATVAGLIGEFYRRA